MSLSNLLLQQQMSETQRNLENRYAAEDRRRQKSGFWSGMGNFGGGLLGLAGAGLLGLTGPIGIGLAAGLGSYGGGKLGEQWAGGGRGQQTRLGKNVDTLTGGEKEFAKDVKDRYKRNVEDFQSDQNKRILNKAVGTGIKAAGFAYKNPTGIQDSFNKVRERFGMSPLNQSVAIPDTTEAIATMQAYNPMGDSVSRLAQAPQEAYVPPGFNSSFMAPDATNVAMDPSLTNALPNPVPSNVPSIYVDTLFDNMFNTGAPQGEGVLQYDLYQNQLDPLGLMNFNTRPANNLLNQSSTSTPQMRRVNF